MNPASSSRRLAWQWTALLLAPVSWTVALGILFSLTGEACAGNTREFHWISIAVCILVGIAGLPLAWREWRALGNSSEHVSSSMDRARCMLQVALGLGVLFTLILLVTAIPIALLSPCRT